MSRPIKNGLDYFPFDVDFFDDKRIKVLKSRYGADGITIYIYLLTLIYRDKGYYTVYDDDLQFIISDDLNMTYEKIGQVLNFLLERSLFNDKLFKSDKVLTSRSIQLRYQKAKAEIGKKRFIEADSRFWVLTKDETQRYIKLIDFQNLSPSNYGCSLNKDNSSREKSLKERKGNKSKVNESKEEKIKASAGSFSESETAAEVNAPNISSSSPADKNNNISNFNSYTDDESDIISLISNRYSKKLGEINKSIRIKLSGYLKKADISLIEYAVRQAVEYEKLSWGYVCRIVENKIDNGLRSIDDIEKLYSGTQEPYGRKGGNSRYNGFKDNNTAKLTNDNTVIKSSKFNNYTGTNTTDYSEMAEKALDLIMSGKAENLICN